MNPKSRLNFFTHSPKIIAALGLLILLAGWLFWMADTSPAPPTDPEIATVTPDLSTRSLTGGIGDWPTLPGLVTFGSQVRLLSFDLPALRLSPGSLAEVTLFWQTRPDLPRSGATVAMSENVKPFQAQHRNNIDVVTYRATGGIHRGGLSRQLAHLPHRRLLGSGRHIGRLRADLCDL